MTGGAIAVGRAGGLGSLPAGMLNAEQVRTQVTQFPATGHKPINLNFLAHRLPVPNNAREHAWREKLKPYYVEFGIDRRHRCRPQAALRLMRPCAWSWKS